MAFKLALTPTYKVKIIVDIPNEQGKFDQSDFMAEFLRCDFDRLNDLQTKSIAEVMNEMLIGSPALLIHPETNCLTTQPIKRRF